MTRSTTLATLVLGAALAVPAAAEPAGEAFDDRRFQPLDVFALEWASDPQVSPDGKRVVFVRNGMDVMTDRRRSSLWIVDRDGSDLRPLGIEDATSPRWSPDGDRLLYLAEADGKSQVHVRFLDTTGTARLTRLTETPGGLSWSPDGRWIAFSMRVPATPEPFVKPPEKPEGATWAEPPRVVEKLVYREDGSGYVEDGFRQLFVLPADGGTPRQLTSGPFDHGGTPAWTPDGAALVFSANRRPDSEHEPLDSEVYEVRVADRSLRALTDRRGPDDGPVVSPDGRLIAYLGFDDRRQGYQVTRLHVTSRDGGDPRVLTAELDRDVEGPRWDAAGEGLYFRFDDRGNGKVGYVGLDGRVETLAADLGGGSLDRPYGGGWLSVAGDGTFAYTATRPDRPGDVAVGRRGEKARLLTRLNDDLLAHKELGPVEELEVASSFDGRKVHAWVVKPPGFDAAKKYPLILEIHGGPFANYGDRFAADMQLYAAAGHVVLYVNPRGSTSYGEEFGNLIHHDYPGNDYDDLMSAVDAVVARGFVDERNLFVTGGSGGGVLTAWIVGTTDRFRAAVAAKPVINWASFVLTGDYANFFARYWFPAFPWEKPEDYVRRSPLSRVGNVKTPTMLLTGEADYRTPISESEQYYEALKLRKIPTALVRVPGASHSIDERPSQLIAKVAHILEWFRRHRADALDQ